MIRTANDYKVKYDHINNEFTGSPSNVLRYARYRRDFREEKKVGHGAEHFFRLEERAHIKK